MNTIKKFLGSPEIYKVLSTCIVLLLSTLAYAQLEEPNPLEDAQLSSAGVEYACPKDPIGFEVIDMRPTPLRLVYEWFTSEDGETWRSKGLRAIPSNTLQMPASDLYVKVLINALTPEDDLKFSKEVVKKITQKTVCNIKDCRQTTTGEYHGGTDFNYAPGATSVDWGGKGSDRFPIGIEEYFSEQGIVFTCDSGELKTQEQLGIPLYIDDSLGVNPKNNFYVKENINSSDFFYVKFPTSNPKFRDGGSYRFTMRFYMILPPGCTNEIESGAEMIARTQHGMVTSDNMDVEVYNDATNQLLTKQNLTMGTDAVHYVYGNLIKNNYNSNITNVFRFEMTYYGSFPSPNGLKEFCFNPFFGQFPRCATLAIDYISAEVESVCMAPRIACEGDVVVVSAAGFPRGADYHWEKYSDATYTRIVPWQPGEIEYDYDDFDHPERAYIKMIEYGAFYYRLTNGKTDIDFTLGGKICDYLGPGIKGDDICVVSYPQSSYYTIKDESVLKHILESGGSYSFEWALEAPEGEPANVSKVRLETAPDTKSANIIVEEGARLSSDYTPNKQYALYLFTHMYDEEGVLVTDFVAKDTLNVWIYDQPNVSRLNFVTNRGEDTMCVATSSDTIILMNKEDIMGYTWNFTGAIMDENGTIHINGYDKKALCGMVDALFPVELEVVNGDRICIANIKDTFRIHSTDAPTINCDKLSEPSSYTLRSGQLDTTIYLPIPDYTTSCDDDPALNVHIHYEGDESIHSFDSTYVLHKAQLSDKSKTALTLFAGHGQVDFSVVDGCDKSAACNYSLEVLDETTPAVDCKLVEDYTINVSAKDGCVARPGSNLTIKIPELPDTTFKDTLIMIKAEYAGRSQKNISEDPDVDLSKYSMEKGLMDDYEVGTTFILWKFADASGNAMYCRSRVSVLNKEDMFRCDTVNDIRTSVNLNDHMEYGYASAQAQSTVNPDTKYTLENLLTVPQTNPEYCGNVKLEIYFSGSCVNDNGDVIGVAVDSLISPDDYLKHRFPIGVTNITYVFSSDYFNFDTQRYDTIICSRNVIVDSKYAPKPNKCPSDAKLYVDPENCLASLRYTLDSIPTASAAYFCETKYTYDDCSGSPYNYENLGTSSSLSKDYDTIVYPVKIRRVMFLDENYNSTDSTIEYSCVNTYGELDSVWIKKVQHRNGQYDTTCAEDPIEKMAMMVTNFENLPSCLADSFPRGYHKLIWYFDNGKGDIDSSCVTKFSVVDSSAPNLDTVCKDPEKDVYATSVCEIPYEDLHLPTLSLNDPCDGLLLPEITAYVRQKDSSIIVYHNEELKTAVYPTERHKIVWTFTDKAGNSDSCVMFVNVIDSVALKMDSCDVDANVIVVLPHGECSLKADSLSHYMTFPTAYDMCDDDTIQPIIQRRFNGELVTDEKGNPIVWNSQDFPLGKTDIRWIFIDQKGLMKDSCEKSVIVKTDTFDCRTLKDTVTVNLLDSFFATAEEVRLAGLEQPEIKIDNCHAATLSFWRSDTTDRYANYEIGLTTVKWTFNYVFGDSVVCPQIVNIQDMVPPILDCPVLEKVDYECYGEIPLPYATFDDFLAAGGKLSEMQKYKEGSYRYEETSEGTLPCNYKLTRTYIIDDVRNNRITCDQVYTIQDVTAPVIHTELDTLVYSCDQDSLIQIVMEMEDVVIDASDNCTPDSALVVHKKIETSRSEDIHSCNYNTYTIWRTWTVEDSCGHISSPLVQVIQVVDSIAPKFNFSDEWKDTVLAINLKKCRQAVPALEDKAKNYIHDLCTEIADITVWQVPAAGTIVESSLNVWIYAKDKCGNVDSAKVLVIVQNPKSIVHSIGYDQEICGSDTSFINLQSQKVRYASGSVAYEDEDGIFTSSSTFAYDYYRGSVSESNLIYSDNAVTYYNRFYIPNEQKMSEFIKERTHLSRMDQSDLYYFVIMDTTTQCMDTTSAYLTIKERPRILMESNGIHICEDDSLDLAMVSRTTNPCVEPMGSAITKTGWIIDGVDYIAGAPIPYSDTSKVVVYFAENECGRTTTLNSKFTTCGLTLYSTEDSLSYLDGNKDELLAWRKYQLVKRDSFLLNIHKKYDSANLQLATSPLGINRCWYGDQVTLSLSTNYTPSILVWYMTHSDLSTVPTIFDKEGSILNPESDELLEPLFIDVTDINTNFTFLPQDTARYYVIAGDGVCPAVPSNILKINVLEHVPTAFTPTRREGLNDIFLENRYVVIFDRYGNKVSEGNNGWDGKDHSGRYADPGVYYYSAIINGNTFKGTIELIHLDLK